MSEKLKNNLKIYLQHYPGGFIGGLKAIADILSELALDWATAGKQTWVATLNSSTVDLLKIADNLETIEEEYRLQQLEDVSK